ncbi:MAG: putative 2OG-Fe(II) oxygenase [Pseudomonadota bacterium]|nr:putative 2OG-Fe(II) oxygenase [Pseudomonadota bacterium]
MSSISADKPRVWTSTAVHGSSLPEAEAINRRILNAFYALQKEDFTRRTHFFGGRYENLYLERERIPDLGLALDYAESCAREILSFGSAPLRSGFWFNAQGPGQATTEHTHEEIDELLSGVYYVSVPTGSGDIVLLDGRLTIRVTPVAGIFPFFPPTLAHRVGTNRSPYQRLSLAFSIGPASKDA